MNAQIEAIARSRVARLSDEYFTDTDENYRREVARQWAQEARAHQRTGWTREDYRELEIAVWQAVFYAKAAPAELYREDKS